MPRTTEPLVRWSVARPAAESIEHPLEGVLFRLRRSSTKRQPLHRGGTAMKYLLLIHQGDAPTPYSPEDWARLSEEEQQAVYADYQAINQTPGVTAGVQMQPPEMATTVRVAGRQDADHRRPVRLRQGGARRVLRVRGRRSGRGDRARVARPRGPARRRGRGAPGRGVLAIATLDEIFRDEWGRVLAAPDRLPRRLRPRRGGRPGGVRDRRRALAARGDAGATRARGS